MNLISTIKKLLSKKTLTCKICGKQYFNKDDYCIDERVGTAFISYNVCSEK